MLIKGSKIKFAYNNDLMLYAMHCKTIAAILMKYGSDSFPCRTCKRRPDNFY